MYEDIIDKLRQTYTNQGYVTEDMVFDACLEKNIPLNKVQVVCDNLISTGVVIVDDDSAYVDDETDIYDKSKIDYDELFDRVIEIDDSLTDFIREVRDILPPQHRECQNLIPQAKNGNVYASERILTMYLRVVVKISLWFYDKYGLSLADTIQDGCIGLKIALKKYNTSRHDKFSTYFPWWIRQYIMRNADAPNASMYFPVHYKDKLFSVYELFTSHLCDKCNDNTICPTLIENIAEYLDCNNEYAKLICINLIPMLSVEEILEEDENIFSDYNELESSIIDNCDSYRREIIISEVMTSLRDRERDVLKHRYGFYDNKAKTLESVGEIYDVTRERIRQIEAKAIRKLSHPTRRNKLKDFY